MWIAAGAGLGLIVGSYLATILVRWPQGRAARGRSACDGCGVALGPLRLIPILSWAWLGGRCDRCGARIDRRHPLTEAACAAIGAIALAVAPDLTGLAGAVFGWLLLALAGFDLDRFWLPDRLTLTLAVAGAVTAALGLPPQPLDRLIGGAAGFLVLRLIAVAYRRSRGREGMGGGDAKLAGAIGLWLGWRALPLLLLGASLAGLAAVALARLGGRRIGGGDAVPFGAPIAAVAWLLWLWTAAGLSLI